MPKFAKYGAFALVVAAAMGGSYYYRGITPVTDASATTNMSSAVYSAPSDAAQKVIALPDFEQIAAKQGPAVVNISVSGTDFRDFRRWIRTIRSMNSFAAFRYPSRKTVCRPTALAPVSSSVLMA